MAPGMDTNKISELCEHTKNAYDAEISQNWGVAYDLHEFAKKQWAAFADTAKFLSRADKVTKSLALRRVDLHVQRLGTLRPFAKQGQPVPRTIVMHPSKKLTMMGFSERVDLHRLAISASTGQFEHALPLTTQERKTPGQQVPGLPQYTASLAGHPSINYRTEFTSKLKLGLDFEMVTVTISDVETGNVLLILEARTLTTKWPLRVNEAFVFRAADYPNPAFTLLPNISKPTSALAEGVPLITLVHGISGMEQPISEVPDRLGRRWGPCRFNYGGRAFVRRPLEERKPQSGDSVHEFTTAWPKPGSKTGKLDDDSTSTSLFNIKYSIRSKQSASATAELDPLFKEYLFAVQLMKITTDWHGALPPRQSLAASAGLKSAAGAAVGAAAAVTIGATILDMVMILAGGA